MQSVSYFFIQLGTARCLVLLFHLIHFCFKRPLHVREIDEQQHQHRLSFFPDDFQFACPSSCSTSSSRLLLLLLSISSSSSFASCTPLSQADSQQTFILGQRTRDGSQQRKGARLLAQAGFRKPCCHLSAARRAHSSRLMEDEK